MAEIWRGAPVAAALTEDLKRRAEALKKAGIVPTLALLREGERDDDIAYESAAMKRCEAIGIAVRRFLLPVDCGMARLLDTVGEINRDDSIHGCLLFRPLPDKAAETAACALLAPEKDMDGMTPGSMAAVFAGHGAGYAPCTAQAVMELLTYYGAPLSGRRAAVVGRSLVIGRPVAMLLQQKNATVTVCHSKTPDPAAICRKADIVIAAAGKARLVDASFTAPGQILVDVGIHTDGSRCFCGDVDFAAAEPVVQAITPVPGGVGSVTTAVLAKHVVEAAEKAAGLC